MILQTFLPYPSFDRSAFLDPQRLGSQSNDVLVTLRVCQIRTYGWQHHTAVGMWRRHNERCSSSSRNRPF